MCYKRANTIAGGVIPANFFDLSFRQSQGSDRASPHGGARSIERLAAKLTAVDHKLSVFIETEQFGRSPRAQAMTFAARAVNFDARTTSGRRLRFTRRRHCTPESCRCSA
jgi:hypothetical protein